MFGFNPDKLSIKCQLCLQRMKIAKNRKLRVIATLKAEVAEMMKAGQDANSRIRVEEVIRQEWLLQGYTMLESHLHMLQTRAALLKKAKEPPPDMLCAINTVMFAAERVKFELDEMPAIADILMSKFKSALAALYQAPDFQTRVTEDHTARELGVDDVVIAALSVMPPSPREKLDKLEEIAAQYDAPFDKGAAERDLAARNARIPRVTAPTVPSPYDGAPGVQPYAVVAGPAPAAPPVSVPVSAMPAPAAPRPPPPPPPPPPPAAPPTRPLGPVKVLSTKDPWAPLKPTPMNLGYGFDDRLDTVAQFIANKRTASGDSGSTLGPSGGSGMAVGRSGSGGTGLGTSGSITSAMAADVAAAAEEEEGASPTQAAPEEQLPEVPSAISEEPPAPAAAPAGEDDDLIARLQRLRNL